MFRRSLLGLLLLWTPLAWAAPDTTLTIAPDAVSGDTIRSADENSRNSTIETAYNSHGHTDSSQLANTTNLGDGTAGNKTLCGNAADSSDSCIRWDDTANKWTLSIDGTTFNQILVSTGTASLTSNRWLIGDGGNQVAAATATDGAAIDTTISAGVVTVAWDGDEVGSGTDPALSSCGTSPGIEGNDWAGRIRVGTGSTTTCILTFNTAFASTPMCVLQNESSLTTVMRATTVAASVTITASQNLAGQFISYHCQGLD